MSKVTPRRRFGQHFLHDKNIIDNILANINPTHADHLIEIGPGLGALTTKLLPLVDKLHVIEIDRDLIPILKNNCHQYLERLVVHQTDVLKFDFSKIDLNTNLRIIGNLPYNISTPLIFHLIKFINHIKDLHFMLQFEVAARLVAKPGSKDYGRLTVMCQYYFDTSLLFNVGPHSFTPPPQVNSAVVRLTPIAKRIESAQDLNLFGDIVRDAFNHRRKTIHNCLKNYLAADELQKIGINPMLRPEQISVDNFVRISNILKR